MKKKGLIVIIALAALFLVMQILVIVGTSPAKASKKNVVQVTAPEQKEAMENEQFVIPEFEMPEIKGKNVALNKPVEANGFTDVYEAYLAVDGDVTFASYWEGSGDEEVQVFTLDMEKKYNIHTIVIALNPETIWAKRTQTFSVSVSNDGKKYTELLPSADYEFDPITGNLVIMDDFEETQAQYVQISFTGNTGAIAGQMAELQVYSND